MLINLFDTQKLIESGYYYAVCRHELICSPVVCLQVRAQINLSERLLDFYEPNSSGLGGFGGLSGLNNNGGLGGFSGLHGLRTLKWPHGQLTMV